MPSTTILLRRHRRTKVLVKKSESIFVAVEAREDDFDLDANSRGESQAMTLTGSCESIRPASDQSSAIRHAKGSKK